LLSLALGAPLILEFAQTGLVPRIPTAILATGIMVLAALMLTCGIILETVTTARREMKRLTYLQIPVVRGRPLSMESARDRTEVQAASDH
jgi:hypothetical protein